MNGDFKVEFWEAALAKIKTLEDMDSWDVVDRTNDMNVLASIWAFKIKRFPDGLIKKFKARFCARGDQQLEGINFFKTYAPVVQWTTVWLLLILEVLLKLKSKQGMSLLPFCTVNWKKEKMSMSKCHLVLGSMAKS